MKKEPFQVSVNDQFKFAVQPDEVKNLDAVPNGAESFHLLENGQSFHARVLEIDYAKRRYTIQVDGIVYTAHIADYYERLINALGLSSAGAQKMNKAKAPMPGTVLEVLVGPGQAVQKDDALVILEAMKMENIIKADGDGVVKSIQTEKGRSVEKGQVLIEFE